MLDSYDLHITVEGCVRIAQEFPKGETNAFFYKLDDTRPKMRKKYAKPFFKFYYKGKGYQIANGRKKKFLKALQDGITGDSEFMIGFRPLGVTNVHVEEPIEIPAWTLE
jgi:hypothetical protein